MSVGKISSAVLPAKNTTGKMKSVTRMPNERNSRPVTTICSRNAATPAKPEKSAKKAARSALL